MNILLIGKEIDSKNSINSYSSMQSFFLNHYLKKMGINTFFHSANDVKNVEKFYQDILVTCKKNNIDHLIALGVNFFGKTDRKISYHLSKNISGMVTQIHDGTNFDDLAIDLNFSIKDEAYRFKDNINNRLIRHNSCNHTINWAADNDLFKPEQKKDNTLRVFVDHTTFTENSNDFSLNIFMNLKKLSDLIRSNNIPNYNDIVVKTLTDKGVEIIDLNDLTIKPYNRKAISAKDFAKELNSTDIFFVTHDESIGLCVLEAAMSGALVFAPKDTINEDLLNKVNHFKFNKSINWNDWESIEKKLNPKINSLIVQKYNWENYTLNIIEGLIKCNKRNEKHIFPIKL